MIMIQRKNMKHHCILILRNPLEVIDTIRRKLKLKLQEIYKYMYILKALLLSLNE